MNTSASQTDNRKRALYWARFILVALLLHALLFVGVRQGFFEVFRKSVQEPGGASSSRASFPEAMYAITIEIEEGEEEPLTEPAEKTTPDPPTTDPSDDAHEGSGEDPLEKIDLDALTGEAAVRIPADGGGGGRDTAVPPRPVEITWPETRGLGHCLGLDDDAGPPTTVDLRSVMGVPLDPLGRVTAQDNDLIQAMR